MSSPTQKRPLSAYFLYRESEAQAGHKLSGKETGENWKQMSEEEKRPFIAKYLKAKAEYDKYLEDKCGLLPVPPHKTGSFNVNKIKAVCTSKKLIQPMDTKLYRALGKTLEQLLIELGKAIEDRKNREKMHEVTFDLVRETIKENPLFDFLKG